MEGTKVRKLEGWKLLLTFNPFSFGWQTDGNAAAAVAVSWDCSAEFDASSEKDMSFLSADSFVSFGGTGIAKTGSTVRFQLKTQSRDCVLLYSSGPPAKPDFAAVELVEGHLRVSLDAGGGSAVDLFSDSAVNDGLWHQVELKLAAGTGRTHNRKPVEFQQHPRFRIPDIFAVQQVPGTQRPDLLGRSGIGPPDAGAGSGRPDGQQQSSRLHPAAGAGRAIAGIAGRAGDAQRSGRLPVALSLHLNQPVAVRRWRPVLPGRPGSFPLRVSSTAVHQTGIHQLQGGRHQQQHIRHPDGLARK